MILKIGTITRRKIMAFLLTAVMVFSLLPAGLPAAEDGGATLIPSGDYTISSDGIYRLADGYSGIITIAPGAYGVTVRGSADGKNHPETGIIVAERPLPLRLVIEDLKITAPEGKSGIDFGNAIGVSYEKWPYNLNNAEQPAPYSLANLLLIGGDCSVTGGKGRAGVYVGDKVLLMIDKALGRTDAQASLAAAGGEQGSGIGGDRGFTGGSVTINGGKITATGGEQGAGLGGLVGAITINGGTVTATGGWIAPGLGNLFITTVLDAVAKKHNKSIDKLLSNSSVVVPGETIIINGGTVTAVGNHEAGISVMGGNKIYQYLLQNNSFRQFCLGRLTVNGGSVTAFGSSEMDSKPGISGNRIEINAGLVSAFSSEGPGINGVTTMINGGTVLASGGSSPNEFLNFMNNGLGQLEEMMDSPEGAGISEEASRALETLNDMTRSMTDMLLGGLFGSGGSGGGAGIGLLPGDSLTINDGIVIARGGSSSAGIGGSVMGGFGGLFAGLAHEDFTPGPVTINGGLVSATGGSGGAGIGGGYKQKTERITIGGNPTVIATRGSDGAQDIGPGEGASSTAALLKDPWGQELSYIRLEVKNKTIHQPLPDKKVTVDGVPYFTNKDGLTGCFVLRTIGGAKGKPRGASPAPAKIMVRALASSAFPGAATEIIPREQNIRAAIELDCYLQNIALQGISEDNAGGVPLFATPVFDPQQADYTLDVENTVTNLKVIPERTAGDDITTILVNGSRVQSGEAAFIPLQIGENNILVTVILPTEEWTAESSPLRKEYLIKVNRANMGNLPLLALRESNLPLDEGDTFLARYALELPVPVDTNLPLGEAPELPVPVDSAQIPTHIRRTTIGSAAPAPGPGYGKEPLPSPSENSRPVTWPGIWTGTWQGTVDYGDGSGLQTIDLKDDGSFDLEHRYGTGGEYPVKVALAYEDSGLVSGSLNVKVNYVAPQIVGADIVGEPFEEGGARVDKNIDINEGGLLVLEGSVADPGDNSWIVTLDSHDTLGPLEIPLKPDKTFTVRKTIYEREPISIVKWYYFKPAFHLDFLVQDDTGLTGARRLKVNVKNVAPLVEAHGMSLAQRGLAFGGAGSFTDPGRDRWHASVDYGDGKGPQPLPLKVDKTFELSHVYMQTGNFTVTVRVEDEDGGVGTASFPVKVKDYIFTLEAGADTSINEGAALVRSVPVRGPARKVQSITVDYGDGSAVGTLALDLVNQSGLQKMGEAVVSVQDIPSAYHQYLPIVGQLNLNHTYVDNGKYTVTVKLTDTDGDVYKAGFRAEVANVAPVVSIKSGTDYRTMESFTCFGAFTDPGSDTWTAVIDFGDGGGVRELRLNDDKTFSVSHSYNSPGSYTITVAVSDDDGGIGQIAQRVSVRSSGGGISPDADLYSLNIGVTFAPDFDRNVTAYTVTGAIGDTQLTVTAHLKATIRFRVTPDPVFHVIPQNTATNIDITKADLIIEVTAENGDTKIYTIDNSP